MKIPVYQKRNTYQTEYAQTVPLASAMLAASTTKNWQNAEMIGSALNNMVKLYQIGGGFADQLQEGNKSSAGSQEKNPALLQKTSYEGFSSPARRELYQFSQTKAWQNEGKQLESSENTAQALGRLDNYFQQQIQAAGNFPLDNPDQNLLAQDYGVIRQEMQHLLQQEQQQQQQAAFERGAGQFVQTAGLIRTPGALAQYIQANLLAAEQEFSDEKKQPALWQQQKNYLYNQAVSHNIEAALKADELPQAEKVYEHFKTKLPQELQMSLQNKIERNKADVVASSLATRLYTSCVSEEGEVQSERVREAVHRYCAEQGGNESVLVLAVENQLAAYTKKQLQQQANAYLNLLTYADSQSAQPSKLLLNGWEGLPEQTKYAEKLVYSLGQPKCQQTNAAVFNQLQCQLYSKHLTQHQIDEAFDRGDLSAADTLRLKSRCCLARAGQNYAQDKMLFGAVHRLCEKADLDTTSTQEAVYTVFTSGETEQEHLKAVTELKKWLVL